MQVQDDYQDHLESEYKSMENMLGLEGGQLPGGSGMGSIGGLGGNLGGNLGGSLGGLSGGGNMGGMSGGLSDMGSNRMNDQSKYGNYFDMNRGGDDDVRLLTIAYLRSH